MNPFDTAPAVPVPVQTRTAKNDLDNKPVPAGVLRDVIQNERDKANHLRNVLIETLTAEIKEDRRRIKALEARLDQLES